MLYLQKSANKEIKNKPKKNLSTVTAPGKGDRCVGTMYGYRRREVEREDGGLL